MLAKMANLIQISVFLTVINYVASLRSNEMIYYEVEEANFSMCIRRFNSTHQIGCSSSRSGDVGVIHYIESYADLEWIVVNGTHHPYIALMHVSMFNRSNIDKLKESGRVNGVVLVPFNDSTIPDEFSPDSSCPNDRFGMYHNDSQYANCKEVKWNEGGNRMMLEDLPFPFVVLFNETTFEFILKCYDTHNRPLDGVTPRDYPLCAMRIKDVMDGAKDTPTCIRRTNQVINLSPQRYCDPLGNNNILAYMDYVNESSILDNNSVTVVAARLDSFSMFDKLYPGVDTAVMGFVAVHAIAEALGRVGEQLRNVSSTRPLLFALFHGEAFDYIGSSRTVYDILDNKIKPLTLESIDTFIEIGQLGLHSAEDTLYVHTDPRSRDKLKSLIDKVISAGVQAGLKVNQTVPGQPLPPASLQRFLKQWPSMKGLLVSNHNTTFTNKHYNSIFDRPTAGGMIYPADVTSDVDRYNYVTPVAEHIARIATTVARVVYDLVLPQDNTGGRINVTASNLTITRLLYCYTINPDCELLNMTSSVDFQKNLVIGRANYLSRYVGVKQGGVPPGTSHHFNLFTYHIGVPELNLTRKDCETSNKNSLIYTYMYLQGPINETDNSTRESVCMRSAVSFHDAVSPAFVIPDYQWTSEEYSAWSESSWDTKAMQLHVFLVPSPQQELMTLLVGLTILIASLLISYLVSRAVPRLLQQPSHLLLPSE